MPLRDPFLVWVGEYMTETINVQSAPGFVQITKHLHLQSKGLFHWLRSSSIGQFRHNTHTKWTECTATLSSSRDEWDKATQALGLPRPQEEPCLESVKSKPPCRPALCFTSTSERRATEKMTSCLHKPLKPKTGKPGEERTFIVGKSYH